MAYNISKRVKMKFDAGTKKVKNFFHRALNDERLRTSFSNVIINYEEIFSKKTFIKQGISKLKFHDVNNYSSLCQKYCCYRQFMVVATIIDV